VTNDGSPDFCRSEVVRRGTLDDEAKEPGYAATRSRQKGLAVGVGAARMRDGHAIESKKGG